MRNIFYSLTGIMLLLGITACSEEERYATSVVKEIQLFLDDEPWAVNTGASNKPLFIYTADGEYVANYSSLYRFQLPNGSYNIISTTQSDSIPSPKNLNDIVMSKEVRDAMIGLRKFMFERVYEEPNTKKEEDKIKNIIGPLYEYYLIHVEQLPEYNKKMIDKPGDVPVAVCDYIAGMTDHFAIEKYTEIFIPKFFMQK